MIWLRLIRWSNLLIIVLTQALIWACVLLPLRHWTDTPFLLNPLNFSLVCLSTVLIAAAGYIINDYFDIKIDAINRPEKVILEGRIERRLGILYHSLFNIVGLVLAALVALQAHKLQWLLLQLTCSLLLFLYSSHFKRWFITGNVVVALLTALTICTLWLYEPGLWQFARSPHMLSRGNVLLPNPLWLMAIYTCFAFVLTWMREVVKDMEDHIGDAAEGCVTMPIRWGLQKTARFVQVLSLFAIVPLSVAAVKVQGCLGIYILLALDVPLIIWAWYLPRKALTAHYALMSRWLKWIMVLGVGSLLIYYVQANG